jgi:acetylornithine/succinyldiaminopimelate/putrescine aminotransferase
MVKAPWPCPVLISAPKKGAGDMGQTMMTPYKTRSLSFRARLSRGASEAEVYRLGVQKGVLFGENRYAGLGNLIKIKPPLDVTRAQMSHALDVLDEVLGTIEQTMR